MSKKLYAALLPVLAVIAFTALPVAAQAATPHWYSCEAHTGGRYRNGSCTVTSGPKLFEWEQLSENELVSEVTAKGWVTVGALAPFRCEINGNDMLENPNGGGAGTGITTAFTTNDCRMEPEETCPQANFLALHDGAPLSLENGWPSTLEEPEGTTRDKISGIQIMLFCTKEREEKQEPIDEWEGSLAPKVGNSQLEFDEGSGELKDPFGDPLQIKGTLSLEGPIGHRVVATGPQPEEILASSSAHSFGSLAVNESKTLSVTYTNNLKSAWKPQSFKLTSVDGPLSAWTVSDGCSGTEVSGKGGTCTVSVTFKPTAEAKYEATLAVESAPAVTMSGEGS